MPKFVTPMSIDGRKKLAPDQEKIMDAQLIAGELTIREAAKINQIRTKYIAKRDAERASEKANRFFRPGELEAKFNELVVCEVCERHFFPKNLTNHQKNFPNGSCISLKGKLLTERRV